jgi:CRISPR system Cascade subunit CasA
MLSLINDPWIPVKDRDGNILRIKPIDIVDESIVDLACQRADFQGAGYQFLIGLLQIAVAPEDQEAWDETWDGGINLGQLKAALNKIEAAFRLGAEKPSFMQDFSALEGELLSVSNLLIEAPGGNTLKLNKDHFIKRGMVNQICPSCAAMALFTLQINAPAGGQGHRTSLRGGGPMTSLVWPMNPETPLWRRLWLNVLTSEPMPEKKLSVNETLFPWCGITRTSEKADGMTTPEMVDKRQVYWGMPRRIELDFTHLSHGECDLCGLQDQELITGYRTKNYGIQYDGWIHPLTPYRQDLKNPLAPLLSIKGQPGGLLYKDWLGLIWQGQWAQNKELPATVVTQAAAFRPSQIVLGLHCFGFDMDKMKARCWYQHQLPLPYIDESLREEFLAWMRCSVLAAKDGVEDLKNAIKRAWYRSPKDVKGDFSFIEHSFWQETEPAFIELMETLKAGISKQEKDLTALTKWRDYLKRELMKRFDDLVFTSPEQSQDLSQEIVARKSFFDSLVKSTAFRDLALKEKQ